MKTPGWPLFKRLAVLSLGILLNTPVLAQSDEVIPDFYKDPGLYPNREYINQSFNEQIDPFSGALQHHYVDLHLPGNGGFDLKIIRAYNSAPIDQTQPEGLSLAAYHSQLGLGWTLHFGRVLKKSNDAGDICWNKNAFDVKDNPTLELPDGSRQILTFPGGAQPLMLTTQRWRADCNPEGGGLLVYAPDGTRYYMDHYVYAGGGALRPLHAWYTSRIVDRNGNTATINYANGPQISTLTTSDGRTVNFTYTGSGWGARLTEISAAGQTWRYHYEPIPDFTTQYFLTSVTRPDGTRWQYAYNPANLPDAGGYAMRRITYPAGGAIDYTYAFQQFDPSSAVRTPVIVKKTLSTGGTWTFAYKPGVGVADQTTVTTPSGVITYRHIGARTAVSSPVWQIGLLESKTLEGAGAQRIETYKWGKQKISDEKNTRPGQFASKEDSETSAPLLLEKNISLDKVSYRTLYAEHDAYGNPAKISKTGPDGGTRTITLTYQINPVKWIINQPKDETHSPSGAFVRRTYDSNANLTEITQDDITTAYTYDTQGNLTSTRFPRNLTHSYTSYKRGIPQTETQPEGISLKRVVSDAGNITAETNGEGQTTRYTYDGLNRITAIQYPQGNPVSIQYAPTRKTVTRGALVEQTDYDPFGRAVTLTLGGIKRTATYDALGRKTFASLPDSTAGTTYAWDILDRPTRITHPDGKNRTFGYSGITHTVTNERGLVTSSTYRAYGDPAESVLMSITPPEKTAAIAISRNAKDQIRTVTQNNVTRTYTYNAKNQLVEVLNPETGKTVYTRDDAGNMLTSVINSAGLVTYTYDGQNRLTTVNYPAGKGTPSVTSTYDKNGKLLHTASSAAARHYTYDANGNLSEETISIDGLNFRIGYTYNANDQIIGLTYPVSGRTVAYTLDDLGRPTRIEGYLNAITYWPSGQIKQIDYANGTTSTYNQNNRLFPSSFSTRKGAQHYHQHLYTYDGVGNTIQISDETDTAYDRVLDYDGIDRLTTVQGPWGGGAIEYDGAGNITRQTFGGTRLDYTYHSVDKRLISVSGERVSTFTYDAYGNITKGFGDTYLYDDVPNLRCINCDSPSAGIEYAYDPTNHRVRVTKGDTEHYEIYDSAGNLLIDYNHDTGALTEYIYLGSKRIADRKSRIGDAGAPTISVVREPNPMKAGQDYLITWHTTEATALSFNCTAAGTGFKGYSDLTLNGSRTDTALAEWVGYDSECVWTATGPGGTTTFKEKLVTTHEKAPTIKVTRTPNPMLANQLHTLKWETTNATTLTYDCVAGGTGWTGIQNMALNGTYQGQAYSNWVDYPSTCTWTAEGPYGKTTYVEIVETVYSGDKPTLSVLRTPNPMVAGKDHTLTWSTTNATLLTYDCIAEGTGWRGLQNMAVNGTYVGQAYHEWVGYPSTCTWTAQGPGGKTVFVEHHETVDLGPKLTFSRVPNPMIVGQPYTLTWNAENAESLTLQCFPYMASTLIAPYLFDIEKLPVSGTRSDYPDKDWAARSPLSCTWTVKGTDGSTRLYVETAPVIYPQE